MSFTTHFGKWHTGTIALAVVLVVLLPACRRDVAIPSGPEVDPFDSPILPPHFPPPHYEPGAPAYSKAGFELGRALFHDPILSVDGTISCASCHRQQDAFSDAGEALSTGVNGARGLRNSQPTFNMAWNRSFMWDGGITHLEVVPFAPIIDPLEMAADLSEVVARLNAHPTYPQRFKAVFGRNAVDDQQLFLALAQYMRNVVSADSPYDRHILQGGVLTDPQLQGLALFRTHCARCHTEPLFSDQGFHNNGLAPDAEDVGRMRVTQDPADKWRFKTPTLRNVALTAPYMHDGRFTTLEQVVEHYSGGMVPGATVDAQLAALPGGFQFTPQEKAALLAFLHALTDRSLTSDPALSE